MILANGCRTGLPGYVDWRAVRQLYARVDYIPQSGLEFSLSLVSVPKTKNCIFPAIWKTVEQTGEDRNQRRQRGARRGSKLSKYFSWLVDAALIDFQDFRGKNPAFCFFISQCYPNAGSDLILFAASCDCDDIIGMSFYLEIGNCKIIAVAVVLFTVNVNGQLIVTCCTHNWWKKQWMLN